MKSKIASLIKDALNKEGVSLEISEIQKRIEIPSSSELGDYSFPCFFLSEKLKLNPNKICLKILDNLKKSEEFKGIKVSGAYLNFFLNEELFAKNVLKEILSKKKNFGKIETKKKKKTVLEFPSPNTNKPLHLGHMRNMAIGEAVARVKEFFGEKVLRVNLNNDRGIHISKSMLAYKKWGNNSSPKDKSDHFVGDYYVLFSKKAKENPGLEEEAQEMLRKWESGDKEVMKLWEKMNKWALKGFKETYNAFGVKHDKEYFESQIFDKAKKIVEEGIKKGIFDKREDGTVFIKLDKENLGEKVILRNDGTSVYVTQDMQLAKEKAKDFNPDESIIITANEQDYHFKVLFTILNKLGYDFADRCKHLSYGMVFLPEGRMKSREGSVVDADTLIEDVMKLVGKRIHDEKLSKKEFEKRSLVISLAAIKYWLLKIEMKKDTTFNPEESISFEGNTGPYLLYSYARANSILEKSKSTKKSLPKNGIDKKEFGLIKKLNQFSETALNSYNELNPAILANYAYELSKNFNEFYQSNKVIGSEEEGFRILLVGAFKQILENCLNLLGISYLDKM